MRSSKKTMRSSKNTIIFAVLSLAFIISTESAISFFLRESNNRTKQKSFNDYSPSLLDFTFFDSPLWMMMAFQNPLLNTGIDSDTGYFKRGTLLPPLDVSRIAPEAASYRGKRNPAGFSRVSVYDSATGNIMTYDKVDKNSISHPYTMTLDDYLAQRKLTIENKIYDSLIYHYDLRTALSGGDLARMLSTTTGLTIPIPPNPVMGLFGKPEININVNGEVNLKAGWRWDSQNLGTVSAFGQTQSSPIFSQDIKVNVTARIGDKFKFSTNWNTRNQFENDNTFKVAYEGEDDDIVKLVEVGNVNMPLPTTLIPGGQTLFGVRADFQFGRLFLKTIASQKRGERRFVDVKGGASKQYFQIRAYDYAKNHFFLDTAYRSIYKEYFKYSTPIIPTNASFYRVKGDIEVWESTGQPTDGPNISYAVAFADLVPKRLGSNQFFDPNLKRTPIKTGEVENGGFLRLDSSRYEVDYNLGTLTIHNMRLDRTYAVGYRIEAETTDPKDDLYYGNLSSGVSQKDTLILKLVYSKNLQPGYKTLWARQMKNIYPINSSNVNTKDTKVFISYINQNNDSTDILQGAPDKLVTILRVDQVNNSTGSTPPDGNFDLRPPFFNSYRGEITFPTLEPFREGLRDYFTKIGSPQVAEQYVFNEIYDTTYEIAKKNTARDRFIVSGEVSGTSSNRISLGAYYLAPGSVRITLDGMPLREFEDYVVDYTTGQVSFRNQRASLPGANLKIEYEQQDIFNLSTKTLLGLRGDYQLYKSRSLNAYLGFTAMYYNQSALIERVRLGEEPLSNTMMGLDAKVQWDAPWLTKALDYLPFYDTKTPSSVAARGEWAIVF